MTDRFLHLTDLHFWQVVLNPLKLFSKRFIGNANVAFRRRHELMTAQAPSFLERIQRLDVRDVILTGDLTSTATDAEFKAARGFVESLIAAGKRPVVIPGNHDVYTYEIPQARKFLKYLGEFAPAKALPAVVPLPGGTPVLYVPTVRPNVISSRGYISHRAIEDTREHLEKLRGRIVVAGHYPLLDRTYGYAMKRNRRMKGAAGLRSALGGYATEMLYICGHVHRFSYVTDPGFDTMRYVTTGALFRKDPLEGLTGAFSEVRIGPDGFRVFSHRLGKDWTVREETVKPADVGDLPTE